MNDLKNDAALITQSHEPAAPQVENRAREDKRGTGGTGGSIRGPEALRIFLRILREEGFLLMYPGQNPKADARLLALRLAKTGIFRQNDILEFEIYILKFLKDEPLDSSQGSESEPD